LLIAALNIFGAHECGAVSVISLK